MRQIVNTLTNYSLYSHRERYLMYDKDQYIPETLITTQMLWTLDSTFLNNTTLYRNIGGWHLPQLQQPL